MSISHEIYTALKQDKVYRDVDVCAMLPKYTRGEVVRVLKLLSGGGVIEQVGDIEYVKRKKVRSYKTKQRTLPL